MNTLVIVLISAICLASAYVLYGRFLAKKWGIDPKAKTPAVVHADGQDYVPTDGWTVFSHQFSSIAGAIARREWSTAGSVMFLLGLSALLEDYTRKRTQTTLTQSLAIHVDTVWRVAEDGSEESIPMGRLALGERIRVRSGALIPVDGTVTDGVHDRRAPPRPQAPGLHRLRRHRAGGGQSGHPGRGPGRREPDSADCGPH